MMANGKHDFRKAQKALEVSGSPKTSRVFYRMKDRAKKALERTKDSAKEFGKLLLKHPKTALAATAITVMLLTPAKTNAQDVSGKTEMVSDKEPTDKTPLPMKTVAGTSTIKVNGADMQLSEEMMKGLNIKAFDGTEKEIVTKSQKEGWIHYFYSENWAGYIRIKEELNKGNLNVIANLLSEGSIYKSVTPIADQFGNLMIITTKGLLYSVGSENAYARLNNKFGIDEFIGLTSEDILSNGKKTLIFKMSNSTGSFEIEFNDKGEIYGLKVNDGIAISQR